MNIVYVPTQEKLEEHLEGALDSGSSTYLARDIEALLEQVDLIAATDEESALGDDAELQIRTRVEPLIERHLLFRVVEALVQWRIHDSYRDAMAALRLLETVFDDALAKEWLDVCILSVELRIGIKLALSRDCGTELDDLLTILEEFFAGVPDPHMGHFTDLIDLLVEESRYAEDEWLRDALSMCRFHIDWFHDNYRFHEKRSTIKAAINLSNELGEDDANLVQEYIESYKRQASLTEDSFVSGTVLKEGLDDELVQESLSSDEKTTWKREMRDQFSQRSRSPEPASAEIVQEFEEVSNNFEDLVERHCECFRFITSISGPGYALYWLLTDDLLVPTWNQTESEGIATMDIFRGLVVGTEGHITEMESNLNQSGEQVTTAYLQSMNASTMFLTSVIKQMIDEGYLTERTIYSFTNAIQGLSSDDLWYITDTVAGVFDQEYTAAIHIGITRIEAALYRILDYKGEDVDSQFDDGTGTRTLGALLSLMRPHIGDDYYKYLKYQYGDRQGIGGDGNLRNRIAHGHFRVGEGNYHYATLIMAEILRIGIRSNQLPFRARFGIPDRILYLCS
jgi:hypothetical protein